MSECIFCKIVEGSLPSHKVFENEGCYAFLDIFPAGRGHTLVIPKTHVRDIHEADALTYSKVAATAKDVADLLAAKLGSEGTTVFQMSREAGWQTVFHLHMHVIPRWKDDGLHKPWDIEPANDADLREVLQQITK
ncbi:HIT family protein [Candidatus Planktophila dulcis]|uniref:HIT family protein n=1 Tax=Candidatus Planktophila dulcis TaxID=1884914 RepID=UPI003CF0EC5C